MLYILSGQDDFSLARTLEEIKEETGEADVLAAGTTTLNGQQLTIDQLRVAVETIPFLSEKRLVIIRGLLERFEQKGRQPRRKKTTKASQTDGYRSFGECLANTPESTVVVLVDGKIAGSNPLFKELSGKAVVKSFPLLKGEELRQWVRGHVAGEGGSISPEAVELLTKLVGGNLRIMASEINKLVLFTAGRRIEEEDVETMVSHAQEASVFSLVDAIVESRASVAGQLLRRLLQSGASPSYLIVMLSRQIRLIVLARELKKQGISQAEMQHRLGLAAEFALRRTLEQANRYSLPRLKEVYKQLLETDLSIKTGKYDAEFALDLLIAELSRQGKARTGSPGSG